MTKSQSQSLHKVSPSRIASALSEHLHNNTADSVAYNLPSAYRYSVSTNRWCVGEILAISDAHGIMQIGIKSLKENSLGCSWFKEFPSNSTLNAYGLSETEVMERDNKGNYQTTKDVFVTPHALKVLASLTIDNKKVRNIVRQIAAYFLDKSCASSLNAERFPVVDLTQLKTIEPSDVCSFESGLNSRGEVCLSLDSLMKSALQAPDGDYVEYGHYGIIAWDIANLDELTLGESQCSLLGTQVFVNVEQANQIVQMLNQYMELPYLNLVAGLSELKHFFKTGLPYNLAPKLSYVKQESVAAEHTADVLDTETVAPQQALAKDFVASKQPDTEVVVTSQRPEYQSFKFEDRDEIRVILNEKFEPLFCLADVCKAMQLSNPSMVTNQIKDEFSTPVLNTGVIQRLTGSQTATFITEPQLYFVMMRGRSSTAKKFRQWLCNEVLPSIRKTGGYGLVSTDIKNLPNVIDMPYPQAMKTIEEHFAKFGINLQPAMDHIVSRARGQGVCIGMRNNGNTVEQEDQKKSSAKRLFNYGANLSKKIISAVNGEFTDVRLELAGIHKSLLDLQELFPAVIKQKEAQAQDTESPVLHEADSAPSAAPVVTVNADESGAKSGSADAIPAVDEQTSKDASLLAEAKFNSENAVNEVILEGMARNNERIKEGRNYDDSLADENARKYEAIKASARCLGAFETEVNSSQAPDMVKDFYRALISQAREALIILSV